MDPDCPLRFNLSHSGMLGTCALSVDCEIGVDVEQIRAMPDLFDIARQFFSPAECVDLKTAPPEQREAAFFSCWTRKEAYIKAIGGGISIPLDSFRVSLLPGEPVQLLSAPPQHGGPWTIQSFDPAPDYRGAVAYNKSPRQLVVRTTSAEEVFAVCAPRGVTRKR